jgi:hypothetical protein
MMEAGGAGGGGGGGDEGGEVNERERKWGRSSHPVDSKVRVSDPSFVWRRRRRREMRRV